jgi:hypothetical protein
MNTTDKMKDVNNICLCAAAAAKDEQVKQHRCNRQSLKRDIVDKVLAEMAWNG